jgi:hypothetical protein
MYQSLRLDLNSRPHVVFFPPTDGSAGETHPHDEMHHHAH